MNIELTKIFTSGKEKMDKEILSKSHYKPEATLDLLNPKFIKVNDYKHSFTKLDRPELFPVKEEHSKPKI